MNQLLSKIKELYEKEHKENTYEHCLNVSRVAIDLGKHYQLNVQKLEIASLLHDISVIYSPDKMLTLLQAHNEYIDEAELKYPFLCHQRVSKMIAKDTFNIEDPSILNMICFHTTLRKDATIEEMVIFIADKLAWDQEGLPPYYEHLKELAYSNIEEACYYYLQYQIDHHLLLQPHRWLLEAYEWLYDRHLMFVQIDKMFKRKTIRLLEKQGLSYFYQELHSNANILWTQDVALAKEWIIKHEDEVNYYLFLSFNEDIKDFIKDRYSFTHELDCFQAVYDSEPIPLTSLPITIKLAQIEDIDDIMAHYDHISKEEMLEIIKQGHLHLAYENNDLAGFIGEHLEGSMGMLYIFEKHRKKGYGSLLESYMINYTIKEGYKPYCHVETNNQASLSLQKKLGLKITKSLLYWLY